MPKHDLKSRNSGPSTSKSIITLLADVCWFHFFGWDKVGFPYCMSNGCPVGSKWWHHFSSPTTTRCRSVWHAVQYAAYVPPILTYNAPFVCVCVCVCYRSDWEHAYDIKDAVKMQAHCWHLYSVPLTGNKQSDVCPHT